MSQVASPPGGSARPGRAGCGSSSTRAHGPSSFMGFDICYIYIVYYHFHGFIYIYIVHICLYYHFLFGWDFNFIETSKICLYDYVSMNLFSTPKRIDVVIHGFPGLT